MNKLFNTRESIGYFVKFQSKHVVKPSYSLCSSSLGVFCHRHVSLSAWNETDCHEVYILGMRIASLNKLCQCEIPLPGTMVRHHSATNKSRFPNNYIFA